MSVIAQLYLIPLISGRHGRPATKLPVRKIIIKIVHDVCMYA